MKKIFILFGSLLFLSISANAQQNEPFARFPSISPDGSTIAFSYQGDIWTVPAEGGRAWRMTIHEAYDSRPQWSPDGEQIAFISGRHGNDDIFVMNAGGGSPKRLTFHSASDHLTGWTHGNGVIFTSNRLFNQVEWDPEIQTVSADGGTPERFFDAFGMMASESSGGRYLVFVRGYNKEYRLGYRGPANKNLWLFDKKKKTYRQLTDFKGNDMYPKFADNNSLYFISERGGTHNIYKTTLTGEGTFSSSPRRLTHLKNSGVRYFDVNGDGSRIVFESKTGLYTFNEESGSSKRLPLEVSHDQRYYNLEQKSFTDKAEEFAISPDGSYLAFIIEGEIFVKHNDPKNKRSVKITDHPYRDREVAFLDESTLIFSSDRNGQYDLYTIQPAQKDEELFDSFQFNTKRLTFTAANERNPVVSPDGGKVVFNRGRGQLVVADIEKPIRFGGKAVLLDTGWSKAEDVTWSPDSEWLAYSLADLNFNSEIYIQPVNNSQKPVNISKHPRPDTNPVWSPDGKKLAFLSTRNNGDNDIWFTWLRKRDWQRTQLDWSKSEVPEEVLAKDTAKIEIGFDGLYKRLQQVTSMPGNESDIAISKNGQTFYFVANHGSRQSNNAGQNLYRINWNGTKLKTLTEGGKAPYNLRLNINHNALYLMHEEGKIGRFNLVDNQFEDIPFNAKMAVNHKKQHEQIFGEAWRKLNNNFYDPDFHGRDWEELHDRYKPWALKASSPRDFEDVINIMLGQLNASHMGFDAADRAELQKTETGLLGVEVEPAPDGVRVKHVVTDSPADREVSKLNRGDVITAVNNQPVTEVENFYSLLQNKADIPTLLMVKDSTNQSRRVIIEPTDNLSSELYSEWVEKRKELTKKYSDGRLGYIHIQGMNWKSFERFERELVAAGQGKEGIVIDVRFNGGGWTTDYLLTVLSYRQHAYTIPRGSTPGLQENRSKFREYYPFGERLPFSSWNGPSIALINQNSYSNAEIFAHAYKNLNLGTLVGGKTFGAVISTGGASLMGGASIRVPYRGWYVKTTDENMEHSPVVPDIEVNNTPGYRTGEDTQLKRAVDALLKQIND